jgi:hypothetical protein
VSIFRQPAAPQQTDRMQPAFPEKEIDLVEAAQTRAGRRQVYRVECRCDGHSDCNALVSDEPSISVYFTRYEIQRQIFCSCETTGSMVRYQFLDEVLAHRGELQ